MKSFTEALSGKDKWCIILYFPGVLLGMMLNGETLSVDKCRTLKGPSTIPSSTSLLFFPVLNSSCHLPFTDVKFFDSTVSLGPL